MTFPKCREDDYYNQDFLDGTDKEFLRGFDWAIEMVVDNFFDILEYRLSDNDTLLNMLNKKIPKDMREEYTMEFTYPADNPRENEDRKVKTYADWLRFMLLKEAECNRNNLIISMIDDMDEKIYNAIRNKVLKDNEKTEHPKEYYDTRKYIYTGKKIGDGPMEDEG
jgi:hypothetical protein